MKRSVVVLMWYGGAMGRRQQCYLFLRLIFSNGQFIIFLRLYSSGNKQRKLDAIISQNSKPLIIDRVYTTDKIRTILQNS